MRTADVKYYRDALEVQGKLAPRRQIRNALNRIASQTKDPELARLVRDVIQEFDYTGSCTTGVELRKLNGCRGSTGRLAAYLHKALVTE